MQSGTELVEALDALEAETVVLNVWATWCGPCIVEFPHFVRFAAEQADARGGSATGGTHVRFVSTDAVRDTALVTEFLERQNVAEPSFHHVGPGDIVQQLAPFAGGAIPVTMILDGRGIVRDTHIGTMTYEELTAAVDAVRAMPRGS